MSDEELYLKATNEVEGERKVLALWAKVMALTEGNQEKAKYQYIKLRVEQLANEKAEEKHILPKKTVSEDVENINTSDSGAEDFFSKLARGDYGLAQTYWLFGISVGVVVIFFANVFTSGSGQVILLLGYMIFEAYVSLGVWRASDKYTGLKAWAVLAKIAVVLGWFSLGVGVIVVLRLINA